MITHPVTISVKSYSGRDTKKIDEFHRRIEAARWIERYLNTNMEDIEDGEARSFDYWVI